MNKNREKLEKFWELQKELTLEDIIEMYCEYSILQLVAMQRMALDAISRKLLKGSKDSAE